MKFFISLFLSLLIPTSVFAQSGFSNGAGYDNGIKTSGGSSGGAGSFTTLTTSGQSSLSANVGIATTAPIASLEVQGTELTLSAGSGGVNILNVGTANIGIGTFAPTAELEIMKTGTDRLFSVSSGPGQQGDYFTIDNKTGNVGIGTDYPLYDVTGVQARVTMEAVDPTVYFAGDNIKPSIAIVNRQATNFNDANLQFLTTDTNGGYQFGSKIVGIFTNHTPGGIGADMAFTTVNAGSVQETMRLIFNGIGGNVGIGTTVPFGKLEVKGGGTTSLINFLTRNSAGTPLLSALDNGNFGVGTITPGQELDVEGTLGFIQMQDSSGVRWKCKPAVTTGVFTCQ